VSNCADAVLEGARRSGGRPVLMLHDARGRFRIAGDELADAVLRRSSALAQSDIGAGTRILLLERSPDQAAVTMLAALRCGATVLAPEAGDPIRSATALARRTGAGAAAGPAAAWLLASAAAGRLLRRPGPSASSWPVSFRPAPGHPALVTTTSGTTGRPKLLVRSHDVLESQRRIVARGAGFEAGEHVGTTLPMFAFAVIAAGATAALPPPGWRDDASAIALWADEDRLETLLTSPAPLEARSGMPEGSLRRVKHILVGGAPVHPDLADRILTLAPEARVTAAYGASEAEPIAVADGRELMGAGREGALRLAGLLVGRTAPETLVRIDAGDGPVPQGQGELLVAGPHVASAYLDEAGSRSPMVAQGRRWHRTGDLATLDGEGRIWLSGRISHAMGRSLPGALAVEAMMRAEAGRELAAAALRFGNERIVLAEPADGTLVRSILRRRGDAGIDRVVEVPSLPRDRRHRSKFPIQALEAAAERARRSR
jgi:acyl-CoA synthetase (AMP-forming)/AMP-acid ligase II